MQNMLGIKREENTGTYGGRKRLDKGGGNSKASILEISAKITA